MVKERGVFYAFGGYPLYPGPAWLHNANDGFQSVKVPAAGWVCNRPDQAMIDVQRGGLSSECQSSWEIGCSHDIEHGKTCGLNSQARYNGVYGMAVVLDKEICFRLHTSNSHKLFVNIDEHEPVAGASNCFMSGTEQHKLVLNQLHNGRTLRVKYYPAGHDSGEEISLDVTTFATAYKMLIWMNRNSE